MSLRSRSPIPSHAGRKRHPINAAFWERCYARGDAFWDHGEPAPGLVDYLHNYRGPTGSVLVPGCGFGHDCREFARYGFRVVGLDISARAVQHATVLAQGMAEYRHGDFLRDPAPGKFNWLFEHTCFCAIDPRHREQYVTAAGNALRRGGRLLGIFYNIQPKAGPPFGTTAAELRDRFSPHFRLLTELVPRSYPNRIGKELLMVWEKL